MIYGIYDLCNIVVSREKYRSTSPERLPIRLSFSILEYKVKLRAKKIKNAGTAPAW